MYTAALGASLVTAPNDSLIPHIHSGGGYSRHCQCHDEEDSGKKRTTARFSLFLNHGGKSYAIKSYLMLVKNSSRVYGHLHGGKLLKKPVTKLINPTDT